MRTANPALNDSYFESEAHDTASAREGVMTVQGTAMKTGILTAILCVVAAVTWSFVFPQGLPSETSDRLTAQTYINTKAMYGSIIVGLIGGLVLALITCFRPKSAPVTAPLYAAFQGAFIGSISGIYAIGAYPGIILQAVMLTIGVLVMMLGIYVTRIIVVTDKLRTGIIAATGAVCLVYLATIVLSFFGVRIPYIHEGGAIGIGFSAVVIVIAALNLVLDFDTIERGSRYGAPKFMEWYGAFGLLVTLIWLYLEMLRLLAKLNSRD